MMTKVFDFKGRENKQFQTVNDLPSETIQSDAHLADIRTILKSFGADALEDLADVEMQFADVSDFGDYHDVMLEVKRAESAFMALPPAVRSIFGHSVENWLDTAHDKDKRDELVAAGFIKDLEKDPAGVPNGTPGSTGSGEATPSTTAPVLTVFGPATEQPGPEADGSAGAE